MQLLVLLAYPFNLLFLIVLHFSDLTFELVDLLFLLLSVFGPILSQF